MTEKFDFNDILIEPEVMTDISSRSMVNPYDEFKNLPIFVAPMDTVVDTKNLPLYLINGLNVCYPRENNTYDKEKGDFFTSYSLYEIQNILKGNAKDYNLPKNILIDIANGHMNSLLETVKKLKEKVDCNLMVGNIANPKTYKELSNAGADYIRVGIGNGNGCLTTQQTGIGYPMASLIKECKEIAITLEGPAKIVADGGMKEYSDIIKALALGADYVMVGSLLNKTLESAGQDYFMKIPISKKLAKKLYNKGFTITKKFRGMSTKEVQKKWGNNKLKTSEGVVRFRKVEYTLEQWTQNFTDYLKSAMSYTNSKNLEEYIGNVQYNRITNNAYYRFKK